MQYGRVGSWTVRTKGSHPPNEFCIVYMTLALKSPKKISIDLANKNEKEIFNYKG
jgi:hypothetical protein